MSKIYRIPTAGISSSISFNITHSQLDSELRSLILKSKHRKDYEDTSQTGKPSSEN